MNTRALLAGATGLVGRELAAELALNAEYGTVHVLVRREVPELALMPKLALHVVSFNALPNLPGVDDVYVALGTTIKVAGSQEAFRRVDYEYVVAVALRHTRELPRYAQQQAHAHWERHRPRPAARCRVGVLGLGSVGQAIASAFLPLGYPVAGWSRRPRELPGITTHSGAVGLTALLRDSDLLACALPLTASTRGLLRRETLSQLPPGAYVINVGRGETLNEVDLRALLDEGHLAGAALDVFEREPPSADNWVWSHPRVLATPHIAGEVSRAVVAQQTLEALQLARAGRPQPRAVDRAAGY